MTDYDGPSLATCPRRILVVDDNRSVRFMLQMLLSKMGPHEVEVAGDGPEALSAAEAFRPDIMLLDLTLPNMEGLEVARRLAAGGIHRPRLLVALTAHGQAEDIRRTRDAGFDEHLVKPADFTTLQALFSHPNLSD